MKKADLGTFRRALLASTALLLAVVGFVVLQHAPAQRPTDLREHDLDLAGSGCGGERQTVKTASDGDVSAVSTTQHQVTIDQLRAVQSPSSTPADGRVRPTETTEYVVGGTLTGYKTEADGDFHLILSNSSGRTMIVELSDPGCVHGARFRNEITAVRRQFLAHYTPDGTMRNPHRAIRVRGIGFFDYKHGQTGVAPNGIELHPVLGLGFP